MPLIRPITPDLVAVYREVRLRALSDSPTAFGSTHARESQFTEAEWIARAARFDGRRAAGYLAFNDETPCGIAGCFIEPETPDSAELVSMWVAPDHRGLGIADALVSAVIEWSKLQRLCAVTLMVTEHNARAIRFYERMGFTMTGFAQPYPNDAAVRELQMMRGLVMKGR